MKHCVDCKYFYERMCVHPKTLIEDPVSGYNAVYCDDNRKHGCKDGELFEQRISCLRKLLNLLK